MKYIFLFLSTIWIIVLTLNNYAYGQANLRTAGELSGIIRPNINGFSFGYELTKSEAIFTYSRVTESPGIDSLSPLSISKYIGHNYRISTALEENSNTFFSGGKAKPGLGIAYEYVYNKNQFTQTTRYFILRLSYDVKQNNFGSIDNNDSIRMDKRFTHSFGVVPGFNWLFGGKKWNDNIVLGITLPIKYNINPTDDLKTKDFITDFISSQNGVVQKPEKAWNGTQDDYLSVTPKIDFVWTPNISENDEGNEIGSRIGLLSSFSTKFNVNEAHAKWNFSIGPSLHPKWSSSQVLATVQAEFLDFTDTTEEKDFADIFFLKFYVGIPLNSK